MSASAVGQRIHVMGNSCSGKSTLARRLAASWDLPLVELDALNWEPQWVGLNATNPRELERRIRKATAGEAWIVDGSYTQFCQRAFWPRLQTIIWLDLPWRKLMYRNLRRSWRRWRSKELLWGTNYELFWPQLLVWRKEDSLFWWITTQYTRKRRNMIGFMSNPEWAHVRFVRLTSEAEIESFVAGLEESCVPESAATDAG